MKKIGNILFIYVCILIDIQISYAGRMPEYSDRYPKFTEIIQNSGSLYFAGSWENRYIVVEKDENGQWHVYSSVSSDYSMVGANVFNISDGLIFSGGRSRHKFYFSSKKWETSVHDSIQPSYESNYPNSKGWTIEILNHGKIEKYSFPMPSYNAFYRWRYFPNYPIHLCRLIGASVTINKTIWFTIEFPDHEGLTGIGGLGMFDLEEKRLGIIRDKMLASCSLGLLASHGDTVFIATNSSSEYGMYGDNGLVLVDLKNGKLAQIPQNRLPLDGEYFPSTKMIDNTLWIASDRAIISWNIRNDTWKSFKIENLVANKNCRLYRRSIKYSDFSNGGLPTHVDYDSTIADQNIMQGDSVECYWPESDFAEVKSKNEFLGWIPEDRYEYFRKASKEQRATIFSEILYRDSTLETSIHSFRLSPISFKGKTTRAFQIGVMGGWVNMENVDPIITETSIGNTPRLQWHTVLNLKSDIKQQAFETLDQEQSEIRARLPILDTLLTIQDSMDLYDRFERILHARWLPSNQFEITNNAYPRGIKFNDSTEIWVNNQKLEYHGKILSIGDVVCNEEGDATYKYQILGYSVKDNPENYLMELKIRYIVTVISKYTDTIF
jgi:hypothetical protein